MNNAVLLTLCLLPLRRAFQLKNLGTLCECFSKRGSRRTVQVFAGSETLDLCANRPDTSSSTKSEGRAAARLHFVRAEIGIRNYNRGRSWLATQESNNAQNRIFDRPACSGTRLPCFGGQRRRGGAERRSAVSRHIAGHHRNGRTTQRWQGWHSTRRCQDPTCRGPTSRRRREEPASRSQASRRRREEPASRSQAWRRRREDPASRSQASRRGR